MSHQTSTRGLAADEIQPAIKMHTSGGGVTLSRPLHQGLCLALSDGVCCKSPSGPFRMVVYLPVPFRKASRNGGSVEYGAS